MKQQSLFTLDQQIASKEAMYNFLRTNISKQTKQCIALANELIELRKMQRRVTTLNEYGEYND